MAEQLRSVARSYFQSGTSPAHDWHHVGRVEANAEQLVEAVEASVDGETVRLAVLLHDIGRGREAAGEVDDHAVWGAKKARRLLAERGVDEDRIDAVCHCIRAHRYSSATEPRSPEAAVVSDADNLDALGAVGLARCFTFGGELGLRMHDPELPPESDDSTAGETQFNHIHKKLLDLPTRMYTDAGRKRAEERAAFIRTFVEQFRAEVTGDR